jgi:predicted ATP-grasp superfamily ATP-dependent carboligase
MPSSPTVLVTDGEQRAALAVTRSLGRAGYRVIVGSSRAHSLAGGSKWASGQLVVPDPLTEAEGFVGALARSTADSAVSILLPMADQSIVPVLENRWRFPGVIIPLPQIEIWRRLADKQIVLEEAARLGIPTPLQATLQDLAELESVDLPFPVVVKPSRSLVTGVAGNMKLGVSYADDGVELDNILQSLPDAAWPVLIQQRIVGPGMGVFLLMANGEPIASFAHRRRLEKPPAGGVSVWSESAAVDPIRLDRSIALLRQLDWEGVAMVEYKVDRQSGDSYLMEVNGRFWGSLQLAIDSGVDFPRLLIEHALSRPVVPVHSWKVGVQCRWRLGELDHLIARLRGSSKSLHLPPDVPSIGKVLLHALTPGWSFKARGEVFRWADPMPGLLEVAQWVGG